MPRPLCQTLSNAVGLMDKYYRGSLMRRVLWAFAMGSPVSILCVCFISIHAPLSVVMNNKGIRDAAWAIIVSIGLPLTAAPMWLFFRHTHTIRNCFKGLLDVSCALEGDNPDDSADLRRTARRVRIFVKICFVMGSLFYMFFYLTTCMSGEPFYAPWPEPNLAFRALLILVFNYSVTIAGTAAYGFCCLVACFMLISSALFRELGAEIQSAKEKARIIELIRIHQVLSYATRRVLLLQAPSMTSVLMNMILVSLFATFASMNGIYPFVALFLASIQMFTFVGVCSVCDYISRDSVALGESIYKSDWLSGEVSVRKLLLIMMAITKRPIAMNAPFLGTVDNLMTTAGVKSWYSYLYALNTLM